MAEKIKQLEKKVDEKLTVAEMYASRPRKWLLYTLIVLILVTLVGWSGSSIRFEGLTVTGREVAKGVISGVTHPDLKLMFGTGETDVPYLLLQTMAIAVLGTLIGSIRVIAISPNAGSSAPVPPDYVVPAPPSDGILGDSDGSGLVNMVDAILALRHAMGVEFLSADAIVRADVDGSGSVTMADTVAIMRLALGID